MLDNKLRLVLATSLPPDYYFHAPDIVGAGTTFKVLSDNEVLGLDSNLSPSRKRTYVLCVMLLSEVNNSK